VVKVAVDDSFALDPQDLQAKIQADRAAGLRPCCVVATVGTTSSTAVDPVGEIAAVTTAEDLWLHVDAALAGSAAILPEKRWLLAGVEQADSFVFNPHKWLFTNFDCSAYFTQDADTLISALTILPEYLRTDAPDQVTNFRDWSVPLGRRFRALKLWFVLRHFGVEGLRARLRGHLALAEEFASWVHQDPDFELMAPVTVNTVCFRFRPGVGMTDGAASEGAAVASSGGLTPEEELENLNKAIMDEANATGRLYMTHTKLGGRYTLRLSIGQTGTQREHVAAAWDCLRNTQVVVQAKSS
jgi:aromatic-L-amino-acid decarboxylase